VSTSAVEQQQKQRRFNNNNNNNGRGRENNKSRGWLSSELTPPEDSWGCNNRIYIYIYMCTSKDPVQQVYRKLVTLQQQANVCVCAPHSRGHKNGS